MQVSECNMRLLLCLYMAPGCECCCPSELQPVDSSCKGGREQAKRWAGMHSKRRYSLAGTVKLTSCKPTRYAGDNPQELRHIHTHLAHMYKHAVHSNLLVNFTGCV